MAIATRCITNSITLEPGTSFVLPPGSTIIGASNINNISSNCIDLTTIEQSECYVLMLAGVKNTNSTAEYFETGQQKVIGIEYNGVYTHFDNRELLNIDDGGTYNMNLVYERIKEYIPSIIFSNVSYFNPSDNLNSRSALAIKSFPSIMNNLQIVLQAIANVSPGGGGSQVNFYAKFVKYNDLAASGVAGLPTC